MSAFYFFYNTLDENTQNIFQHEILNNLFTEKLLRKEKEYVDENITELTPIGGGISIPPQWHKDIIRKVIYLFFKN